MTRVGFFGKLPAAGDFVARGLPAPFCRAWDAWVTRHLAQRLGNGAPQGGLRFRLSSGGRMAAGVILPSKDRVGRRFPLTLALVGERMPSAPGLDPWCAAAAALVTSALAPDDLARALEDLPLPDMTPAPESPAMQLWIAGSPALVCDPGAPEAALDRLLGSG
ncbi:type VI secretion system-associated protein TagF [Cereibacter sphaeroides]|uniref:type VI secretion system-associated protein TagF n=1 Tax=Cereibacter sphaeroides TaxID=1063 RepID=UPI001F1F74FA|nr:type VI secretion system-associated protein TagF [Cereibacter sphaeroides]MCE6959793.1 type VI secretion system-associated protein TagF [Cereibacter sphaeroides]MCE6968739.1 type VI secretion system-associated protein TagF [Cereibacter sphaeroides]MCE6974647.1 type VI secretion system-associated protein TagF [Cereibacter sphaeroides]